MLPSRDFIGCLKPAFSGLGLELLGWLTGNSHEPAGTAQRFGSG